MNAYKQLIAAFFGITIIIVVGALGFEYIEGISFFDALWMTIISMLTVGYGDIYPHTEDGKIYAMILIPLGIGIGTYALGAIAAAIIEGKFSKSVGRKRMERKIGSLEQHYIICGFGRVGQQVLSQLQMEKVSAVVIEREFPENQPQPDFLYLQGDATEDRILRQAGIEKAAGLVACLPDDADNVFVTLTAKGFNPHIQIVSRAEKQESEAKLLRAGADKVINPSSIGGRRMAMSILKPNSVEYIDTILQSHSEDFRVEEILVEPISPYVNQSLKELAIREKFGVNVVAIKRSGHLDSHLHADNVLRANDILIVFGSTSQLTDFEKAINQTKG